MAVPIQVKEVLKELMFKIDYYVAAEVNYKMTKNQDDYLERHLRKNDVIRALNALWEGGTTEDIVVAAVRKELDHARNKFPGDNATFLALVEEVGELGKALNEESWERVQEEAIQVGAMALRMLLEGDASLERWRRRQLL